MHKSNNFVLHGGDTAFANRQKLLFEKLSNAEKECNMNKETTMCVNMEVDQSSTTEQPPRTGVKRKHETKRFRGKESIFKRPEGPAPRTSYRGIPDHRRNPHKWVKYSLDDVPSADMTDKSNTQAALSFLKELKARRKRERTDSSKEEMDVDEDESDEEREEKVVFKPRKVKTISQIEFQKPDIGVEKTDIGSVIVDSDNKPIFRSSKVIMPEYVVGQKQKKKSKEKLAIKVDRLRQLRLDHLEELNEDDD